MQANRPVPGARAALSTRLCFFMAGFAMSSWAPMVPFAKSRLGLDDGTLGALLLCLGLGSLFAMPFAGALVARAGCRRVIAATVLLVCVMLPLLVVVPSPWMLGLALLVFGAGAGSLDCTMNIQAILVERAHGRPMMSGFHGLFSVGGIAGAGGVSVLLTQGVSPLHALLVVVLIIGLLLAVSVAHNLPYGASREGPAFAVPHGVVTVIGVFCFVLFLTEGAVLDWSAVFVTGVLAVPAAKAGLCFAAFSTTMTVCRLTGDRFVKYMGPRRTVIGGATLAAFGLALATLVPSWSVALLGFALVGVGCSNIVPVMFSLVGKQSEMPENVAVPAITTIGYAGILLGPALIGFISHASSLAVALLTLCAMLLGVALGARTLKLLA